MLVDTKYVWLYFSNIRLNVVVVKPSSDSIKIPRRNQNFVRCRSISIFPSMNGSFNLVCIFEVFLIIDFKMFSLVLAYFWVIGVIFLIIFRLLLFLLLIVLNYIIQIFIQDLFVLSLLLFFFRLNNLKQFSLFHLR